MSREILNSTQTREKISNEERYLEVRNKTKSGKKKIFLKSEERGRNLLYNSVTNSTAV
jgi:hypothetical protein